MTSEEFDELMAEEMGKWNELGANPGSYHPGEGFLGMIFRFEALNNVLKEKGIITEEEMDDEYRLVSLSGLKQVRETVIEPAIAQAKQEALRARILPPNGAMRVPKNPRKH